MSESNISKDHIALEAMKVILEKSIGMDRGFPVIGKSCDLKLPDEKEVAEFAYDYAYAMIEERVRRQEYENL